MIDHQHVRRLIAWCEARTDDRKLQEIAAALRIMQNEHLDILAALHLPDHGPLHIVEEIRTILHNQDEAEARAEAAERLRAAPDVRAGGRSVSHDSDRIKAWRPILALGQQICEANGAAFRYKTVYEDLILSAGDETPAELQKLMNWLEAVANALDPETGALRPPERAK